MVAAVAILLIAPACAHRHPPKASAKAAATEARSILIGTIALVDEAGKFVLIDSGNLPGPPPGATLKSYAAGLETAELLTSQVRKHPFVIADIRSGEPHKGDQVRLLPAVPPPPAAPGDQ